MARPTKLTPALIKRARQYNYKLSGDVVPTVEGLALWLGVARSSVYLWAEVPHERGERTEEEFARIRKRHEQFSDIVNGLLAEQALLLVNNGLRGRFNANITKLILSGKHGYVEKTNTEHTGKDGGPIETKTVEVMDVSASGGRDEDQPEASADR